MQELARKTVELIRKWPILLLPLLGVDQAALYLDVLRRIASKKIVVWSMTTTARSVTGAVIRTPVTPYEAQIRALSVLGPLQWINYFARIALFTAAFVVTASLIRDALAGAPIQWRDAFATAGKRKAGILFFALKFLGSILAAGLVSTLFGALVGWNRVGDLLSLATPGVIGVMSLLIAVVLAWILAPAALKLINPERATAITAELRRLARTACILCAVASTILSFAVQNLSFPPDVTSSFDPWFWRYPVPSIESALVALPYLPMWIALALLAFPDEPMIEIPSPS